MSTYVSTAHHGEPALELADTIETMLGYRHRLSDAELVEWIERAYRRYVQPAPAQPPHGQHVYHRDDTPHPQGTGRPWRGARYGDITGSP